MKATLLHEPCHGDETFRLPLLKTNLQIKVVLNMKLETSKYVAKTEMNAGACWRKRLSKSVPLSTQPCPHPAEATQIPPDLRIFFSDNMADNPSRNATFPFSVPFAPRLSILLPVTL